MLGTGLAQGLCRVAQTDKAQGLMYFLSCLCLIVGILIVFKTVACEAFLASHPLSSREYLKPKFCAELATPLLPTCSSSDNFSVSVGKWLRSAYDHPLRSSAFVRGALQPATSSYVRRGGQAATRMGHIC